MEYNRNIGERILTKYLDMDRRKFNHSIVVGNCAYMFAGLIEGIDAELVGFLGMVHDIGQSEDRLRHELRTIELLIQDGVPIEIAVKTMHGVAYERFPNAPHRELYLPVGIEGKIITVADFSMDPGDGLVSVEARIGKMKQGVMDGIPYIAPELREEVCNSLEEGLPRIRGYRDELFSRMGMSLPELQARFKSMFS